MKKVSPLKIIRVLAAILFILIMADFFIDENLKRILQIVRVLLGLGLLVFAMFNSGSIESEKIEKENSL